MSPPLKILIATEDLPARNIGGLGKHVLVLMEALARRGNLVDLIGSDRVPLVGGLAGHSLPGRFFPEFASIHYGWKERKFEVFVPGRREWLGRRMAGQIARRAAGYDVIHYHGHVPELAAHVSPALNLVQTRHDQGSDCVMQTRFKRNAICVETAAVACAGCAAVRPNALQRTLSAVAVRSWRHDVVRGFARHRTIFVSEFLRRSCARAFGGAPEQWGSVVHNFIDAGALAQVDPLIESPRFRVEIFIAARLYVGKGVATFLRAFVPHMPEDVRVTVAGDGMDEAELRRSFGGPRVRILGWCDHAEVLARIAACDVLVMPSIHEEAFGATTMEGLALDRTVFALARGATPELACYARRADQLRLFDTPEALAQALAAYDEPSRGLPEEVGSFSGDVMHRVAEIESVYRLRRGVGAHAHRLAPAE